MYVILVLLLYYLPESKKWISAKDLVVGIWYFQATETKPK